MAAYFPRYPANRFDEQVILKIVQHLSHIFVLLPDSLYVLIYFFHYGL